MNPIDQIKEALEQVPASQLNEVVVLVALRIIKSEYMSNVYAALHDEDDIDQIMDRASQVPVQKMVAELFSTAEISAGGPGHSHNINEPF